jgi:NRPS condensation-like uncharacterized protein
MLKLPNKLELNGADCFHLLLENFNESNDKSNNVVRMLISINDGEELKKLKRAIEDSEITQWIAQLHLERKSLKAPAWIRDFDKEPLKVVEHSQHSTFDEVKHQPIVLNRDHLIRFDILDTGSDFKLLFSWHHIIMDGRGAGLLIQLLTNHESTLDIDNSFIFKHPVEKKSFKKRFSRMFDVKHFVEDMLENSLEAPEVLHPDVDGFHHEVISFDKDQSKIIEQNAFDAGCRFGINMFQLACSFLTYKKVTFANKKLWVPIPYDGRKRGSKGPIIGNHISFLFYQIDPNQVSTPKEAVQSLNEQMNAQLKRDIPSKYNDMLSLMRKSPLWFNKWATTRSAKGRISSFLYSSSGQGHWDTKHLQTSFEDLILIPPFSNDPGITFTFSRFNDTIKLNIVACKSKFDNKKLSLIRDTLQAYLLGSENWKN